MVPCRWSSWSPLVLSCSLLSCGGDDGGGASADSTGAASSGSTSGPMASTGGEATTTGAETDTGTTTTTGADESSSGGPGSTGSTGGGSTGVATDTGDGSGTDTGAADCHPLVVEAFYDAEGGDDMLQWVKLYNPCPDAVDLSSWSIGYGGEDYGPPRVKPLFGSVDADACYVVGGPTAAAANGDPIYHYADDFAPGLDVAAAVGGGIALFDLPSDDVDATTIPLDAVVYGPNNDNGLIDETGRPVAAPHVANPPVGGSIRRTSADATWETTDTPTPNVCPPF